VTSHSPSGGRLGEVNDTDRQENYFALEHGLRIMSVYRIPGSTEVCGSSPSVIVP
jgi:hypothetical protein